MTTIEAPKTTPKEVELAEEALRLSEAASSGPWNGCAHINGTDDSCHCGFPGDIWAADEETVICTMGTNNDELGPPTNPAQYQADGQFIARARTLLPLLAQALLRQAAERSRETA